MPAFPERESTLLSKLYQSAPWTAKLHKTLGEESVGGATREEEPPAPVINDISQPVGDTLVSTSRKYYSQIFFPQEIIFLLISPSALIGKIFYPIHFYSMLMITEKIW